eukprot:65209-Pelagomonas_calceolata.AAC.1
MASEILEPVHAFVLLSLIATALYFTGFFRADISLSPGNSSCWTSHLLSAMNGLHHADHFKQKIRSANPLDLSQLVVDL